MALLRRLAVNAPRSARVLSSSPPTRDELDLNFNSPKDAFKSKKTSELVRAYLVYQICSVNWIVENNAMLMRRLRQVIGNKLFEAIMKATFYGQFVAGEDLNKSKPTIERLRSFGVQSILIYSVEEDLSQEEPEKREVSGSVSKQKEVQPSYLNEAFCDKNVEEFLKSIDAVAGITKSTGLMAVKLTALGRPQMLMPRDVGVSPVCAP